MTKQESKESGRNTRNTRGGTTSQLQSFSGTKRHSSTEKDQECDRQDLDFIADFQQAQGQEFTTSHSGGEHSNRGLLKKKIHRADKPTTIPAEAAIFEAKKHQNPVRIDRHTARFIFLTRHHRKQNAADESFVPPIIRIHLTRTCAQPAKSPF